YDENGVLRVVAREKLTFNLLFSSAFDRIRLNAEGNAAVLIRLLKAMDTILPYCRTSDQLRTVKDQIEMLLRAAERKLEEPHDLAMMQAAVSTYRDRHGQGKIPIP
nr:DUF2254 domain-containing protein [Bacteroidota bacterium]